LLVLLFSTVLGKLVAHELARACFLSSSSCLWDDDPLAFYSNFTHKQCSRLAPIIWGWNQRIHLGF
jgi:hypothetical protein